MGNLIPEIEYWRKRGDRAVASRLIHTVALLDAHRNHLRLVRHSLGIHDLLRPYADDAFGHQLARAVAGYYRAEGRLTRRVQTLRANLHRAMQRALRA